MYLGEIVETGAIGEVIKTPRHPYTRALIKAVPVPDPEFRGNDKLPLKSMNLGDLENRGAGCSFFERCLYSRIECKSGVYYADTPTARVLCGNLDAVPSDAVFQSTVTIPPVTPGVNIEINKNERAKKERKKV